MLSLFGRNKSIFEFSVFISPEMTEVNKIRSYDKDLGPISWNDFSIVIKFDRKFILVSSKLWWTDHCRILHMAQQLCCNTMCKIWECYNTVQWSYTNSNFPSDLNYDGKIVSEMGPCSSCIVNAMAADSRIHAISIIGVDQVCLEYSRASFQYMLSRYGVSYIKDKTVMRPSYL